MALYVTRPRRDEVRIGRGLPSGTSLDVGHGIGRGLPNDNENSFNATTAKYGRRSYILVVLATMISSSSYCIYIIYMLAIALRKAILNPYLQK